jgi:hypothetical protein
MYVFGAGVPPGEFSRPGGPLLLELLELLELDELDELELEELEELDAFELEELEEPFDSTANCPGTNPLRRSSASCSRTPWDSTRAG